MRWQYFEIQMQLRDQYSNGSSIINQQDHSLHFPRWRKHWWNWIAQVAHFKRTVAIIKRKNHKFIASASLVIIRFSLFLRDNSHGITSAWSIWHTMNSQLTPVGVSVSVNFDCSQREHETHIHIVLAELMVFNLNSFFSLNLCFFFFFVEFILFQVKQSDAVFVCNQHWLSWTRNQNKSKINSHLPYYEYVKLSLASINRQNRIQTLFKLVSPLRVN